MSDENVLHLSRSRQRRSETESRISSYRRNERMNITCDEVPDRLGQIMAHPRNVGFSLILSGAYGTPQSTARIDWNDDLERFQISRIDPELSYTARISAELTAQQFVEVANILHGKEQSQRADALRYRAARMLF